MISPGAWTLKPNLENRAVLKQTWGTREYVRVVAVNIVRVNRQISIFATKLLAINRGTISDWLNAYTRNGLTDDVRAAPPFSPARRIGEDRILKACKS